MPPSGSWGRGSFKLVLAPKSHTFRACGRDMLAHVTGLAILALIGICLYWLDVWHGLCWSGHTGTEYDDSSVVDICRPLSV